MGVNQIRKAQYPAEELQSLLDFLLTDQGLLNPSEVDHVARDLSDFFAFADTTARGMVDGHYHTIRRWRAEIQRSLHAGAPATEGQTASVATTDSPAAIPALHPFTDKKNLAPQGPYFDRQGRLIAFLEQNDRRVVKHASPGCKTVQDRKLLSIILAGVTKYTDVTACKHCGTPHSAQAMKIEGMYAKYLATRIYYPGFLQD